MAIQIQLRQGTTTEHNSFTGAVGEVTVDTTKDVPVVHDGVTAGGHPVAAKANADGTISLIKKDGTSAGTINADGLFNNTLTSTNTNQALTAAQGKVLKDSLDTTITSSFGIGQTWQNMTASRVAGTTYTNTTGRPIQVSIKIRVANYQSSDLYVGSELVSGIFADVGGGGSITGTMQATVLSGETYRITSAGWGFKWSELR